MSLGRLSLLLPLLRQLGGSGPLAGAASHFEEAAESLARTTVEGRAGGGLVRVTASAQRVVKSIEIDASLLNAKDKGALEDLVRLAVNEALTAGAEAEKRAGDAAMSKLQADLPGMMTGLLGALGAGKRT